MPTPLYPLLTQPKHVEPIWGGSRMAAWLDLPEPHPQRLGEIWLVYDSNPVRNGPLAGRTLAELAREYGADLIGERTLTRYGADMPLLAKFIDADDRLSIQVHPDDAYAHSREAHTGFHGKTEAWYILDAAPQANVVYGLRRPSDRAEFAAAVQAEALEGLMHALPVAAGDVVFVPAGTLHAINAGIMLFEIQQKSDLTYRVYDYGRRDAKTGQLRELHLEKALEVSDFGPAGRGVVAPLRLGAGRDLLVACPYFALERLTLEGRLDQRADPGSFAICTVIAGAGTLIWDAGAIGLALGDAVVLPASLGNYTLSGAATLLHAYVPDLTNLQEEAARAGHTPEQIKSCIHL